MLSWDVRALVRRIPAAAWICALVAFMNAFAWSIAVPLFQGKDEVDHFAYVAQLAETGTLPKNGHEGGAYSTEQALVLHGLRYYQMRFTPGAPAISSEAQQQALTEYVHAKASLEGSGEAGVATSEPPLYYAIQVVPYALASGNMLTQLELMRLMSALLGALTVLLSFLFLREILPGVPWVVTVGALCLALQPQLASVASTVNPDIMQVAVTAGLFLCMARAFRRRFTKRLGLAIGALTVAGFATKLTFVGVGLGVLAGIAMLTIRDARALGWRRLQPSAIAVGTIAVPASLYAMRNGLSHRPVFGAVSGTAEAVGLNSPFKELSYVWQLYLPRLPGMTQYFSGIATYKDIWFDRLVGLYGWMDTTFPTWVDNLALVPATAIAALCGRELVLRRAALRLRLGELFAYASIGLGVLLMLGATSYLSDAVQHWSELGEPRYLMPMIPVAGAVVVLAIRGAGRRWAPMAAAVMVSLFFAHDLFSQLQVIGRYYG